MDTNARYEPPNAIGTAIKHLRSCSQAWGYWHLHTFGIIIFCCAFGLVSIVAWLFGLFPDDFEAL